MGNAYQEQLMPIQIASMVGDGVALGEFQVAGNGNAITRRHGPWAQIMWRCSSHDGQAQPRHGSVLQHKQ